MAWGDTEGGFAQGPHGGVMGGMAGGASSPGEVSDANQAEAAAAKAAKNANALAAAINSVLNSQAYKEQLEKAQKKNKAEINKTLQAGIDNNLQAMIDNLGPSYGELFDTNFNLNIEAPVGLSPGYQGAVTPGVSPPSVSHDFEGLIGQQEENEADELDFDYPITTTYEDIWSSKPVLSDSYSSGGGAGPIGGGGWGDTETTDFDVNAFATELGDEGWGDEGLAALASVWGDNPNLDIGIPAPTETTGFDVNALATELGDEGWAAPTHDFDIATAVNVDDNATATPALFEYEDVDIEKESPVVDFGTVIEDRTEFEAMMERNREIEAQKDKDFLGTDIKARTLEERTKKEANTAKHLTESQKFMNEVKVKEKELDKLKQVPFTKRTWSQHSKIGKLQRQLNKVKESDRYRTAHATVYGMSKLGKAILSLAPYGMGMQYKALSKRAIESGAIDTRTWADIVNEIETSVNKPEGQTTEEQITDLQDSIEGGFWGLLGFAKKNPKIFGPLSGDELWKLVMDEDAFWNYYEQGLLGE